MNTVKDIAQEIEKEAVETLHFPQNPVLISSDDKVKLQSYLDKALSLGNLEHQKVKIYFEDDQGLKFVDTTVWAVSEKTISLKREAHIPIHRIHYVELL